MTGNITRRGNKSWRLKFELGRDPETDKRKIGYKTVTGTKRDAERELREILYKRDKGIFVDPSRITVAEYLKTWLRDEAPADAGLKTLERYGGLIRNQIAPHLGKVELQRLRPADVAAWHQKLVQSGKLSTRSIRHAHGVLNTALAHAAAVEIVERNVAAIIKPPKLVRTEIQVLKADEIADALDKIKDLSIYPVAVLAFGTGARRGEIAALRWQDIDFDAGTVRIEKSLEQTQAGLRVKSPKTPAGRRTVTLPAVTIEALRNYRREQLELRVALGAGRLPDDAPVFGDIEGEWPKPYSISDRWRDAVRNRGLPKVTFHGLRHSHASALIAAGLDIVTISRRLGHASPAITLSVYSHVFEDKDDQAAEAINSILSK